MLGYTYLLAACLLGATLIGVRALDNGVARLPVMGYTSYEYRCNVTQDLVRMNAEQVVSLGLKDLGYNYINLDACYAESNRSATGQIVADPSRFAFGMPVLTAEIHGLGLKAGMYGSSGWFSCGGDEPGSFQNEVNDVRHWQLDWGFDFVKIVDCGVPFDDIIREGILGKYQRMADAIAQVAQESGRDPLVLSVSSGGDQFPYLWASRLGHSWRIGKNVDPSWSSIADAINTNSFISWASDYYGHNDMDYLQIGQGGLTFEEEKTHFTAWAFLKSPLIINTDLSKISKQDLSILMNDEIIAVNQDPVVGKAVTPFRWGSDPNYWTSDPARPAQYWSGETQNGTVFMLINTFDAPATMFFNLTESPYIRAGRQYSVRDLWAHADVGVAVHNWTVPAVPSHGVVALLLQDAGDEPNGEGPPCARQANQCVSESGTPAA
ncbi:glycoside hydrolase family 27 protein [Lentinus tigrinus ALCF2SS1-7]|uniref:glycoside hydrolase family 27 protein n=1 Tax=Lentinus tigrinus ALCF2SS1-7 TaxID=1328758 RepID=UPI00116627FD|nr:glycoside hydrolase family 27 protein [Lentinus tigrinus ALCF2SS1-7]